MFCAVVRFNCDNNKEGLMQVGDTIAMARVMGILLRIFRLDKHLELGLLTSLVSSVVKVVLVLETMNAGLEQRRQCLEMASEMIKALCIQKH